VVVRDTPPDLKSVVNTNMCHLGIVASDSALLIISVIDNLMKGASGQAIQNMNIMFGVNETTGLLTKASAF
jgi:N-acetyl-gamma-glutamyl-phosphate reductase